MGAVCNNFRIGNPYRITRRLIISLFSIRWLVLADDANPSHKRQLSHLLRLKPDRPQAVDQASERELA
jgi:hypothetical protein